MTAERAKTKKTIEDTAQQAGSGGTPPAYILDMASLEMIQTNGIAPSRFQPRDASALKKEALDDILPSIIERGVLQPLLVRRLPESADFAHEMIFGHRRHACAQLANQVLVPAYVLPESFPDEEAEALCAIENLARAGLTLAQEVEHVAKVIKRAGTDVEAARRLGRDVRYIVQRKALSRLIPAWEAEMRKFPTDDPDEIVMGWTVDHFVEVSRLPVDQQESLHKNMDKGGGRRHLSLREFRKAIAGAYYLELTSMPWKLTDATLVPAAGACAECKKRSSQEGLLFEDMQTPKAKDRCLDLACFKEKRRAHILAQEAVVAAAGGKVITTDYMVNYREDYKHDSQVKPSYVEEHDLKHAAAKPKDKDAVPVLIVDTGRVIHVSKKLFSDGNAKAGSKKKGAKVKNQSLEERRENLERRRWKAASVILAQRIGEGDWPENRSVPFMLKMLIELGLNLNHRRDLNSSRNELAGMTDMDDPRLDQKAAEVAWKAEWAVDIHEFGSVSKQVMDTVDLSSCNLDAIDGLKGRLVAAAKFFNIDLDAIKAQVDVEIREPASWAKLPPAPVPSPDTLKHKDKASKPKSTGKKSK